MESDFSGYATKAGLKCGDGRTIMPDAFKHQDQLRVPLVWQHGHSDPENVLGHAILENRNDGVYAHCFFNSSPKAKHTATLVEHKDISMMSIWANDLIERAGRVLHGAIREVSLVLSGANPGALIENVTIRHSDGDSTELDSEAIIYTGLELELSHSLTDVESEETEDNEENEESEETENDEDNENNENNEDNEDDKDDEDDEESTETKENDEEAIMQHASNATDDGETVQDVYDSLSEKQKQVVHFMIGEALSTTNNEQDSNVKHNIFESDSETEKEKYTLSHSEIGGIVADATKMGSLKDAVENFALAHGINDIDVLFPDATAIDNVPEYIQRRTEWVSTFLGAARKSPFSRVKTLSADLTMEEARARGYVKGTLKKEEFFGVSKRVTTPTTVYKKQKLDRDDMVDITSFDIVAWLKAEMRLMLDEEIARAALIGDGRDVAHEDKINEQNIRPIAKDHELYATTLYVNLGDASSSISEFVDAVIMNRFQYKGTGLPNLYTTETWIAKILLLRDTVGRRIYKNLDELATELRVSSIIPVEVLEEDNDIVAIIVNPVDYVFGATRGGEVSMFDDFDIDYNQYKYLIETRLCGALTKLKSAIVVRQVAGNMVLVVPATPTFDPETGALTITNQTGVVYMDGDTVINAAGSPYTVEPGTPVTVDATPASGYYFATSNDDSWTFTADA